MTADSMPDRLRSELKRIGLSLAAASRAMGQENSQWLRDLVSGWKRLSAENLGKLVLIGVDAPTILGPAPEEENPDQSAAGKGCADHFGMRILSERQRIRLSQDTFGAAGGVTRQSQANYEKGKRFPDANYLAGISTIGADVGYIVTGKPRSTLTQKPESPATPTPFTPDPRAIAEQLRRLADLFDPR